MDLSMFRSDGSAQGISRRTALKGLSGMLAASAAGAHAQPVTASTEKTVQGSGTLPKRPNILWITGEGVPLPVLGCYGGRLLETPNIDRIANEGINFKENFVVYRYVYGFGSKCCMVKRYKRKKPVTKTHRKIIIYPALFNAVAVFKF